MDEQNRNPYEDSMNNGSNAAQSGNPYGGVPTNGAPQGTPFAQSQNAYGASKQGGNPYGGAQQGTNPYGAQQGANPYAPKNPYGGAAQGGNPYSTSQQGGNSYGGAQQGTDPYGASRQGANPYAPKNPYAGAGQGGNPYSTTQQGADPYAAKNPYASAGQGSAPYGAGQADPYGASRGSDSYGGVAPEPPKPPKKKMSRKMKALIFGGVGLAALAVGLYFLFTLVIFPPKKTLDTAFENSFKLGSSSLAEQFLKTPLTKELGFDTLNENFKKSGGYFALDLDLGDMGGTKSGKTELKAECVVDRNAKQLSAEGYLVQNGENLVESEIHGDEELTYVTVKDLMNGYIAISNKNVISSLKNSQLVDSASLKALDTLPDFSIDYFGEGPIISGLSGLGDWDFTKDLWDKSKVSRAGSESITIGSDSVKASKYEVTIPKETLQDAIGKLMDQVVSAMDSDQYSDYLSQAGVTASQLKQLLEQYRSMIKSMITDDFIYYAYVYEDKVISLKANGTLKLSGISLDYNFDMVVYADDEKSAFTLNGSVGIMGQTVDFSVGVTSKKSGNSCVTELNGNLTMAGRDYMRVNYSHTYDPSTKKISGSGTVQAEGSTVLTLNLEGEVTELTQGQSVTIDLTKIAVRMDKNEVEGALKLTISTLDASGKSVNALDSSKKVVNAFTASREEIATVIDPTSDGYKSFMERLQKWEKDH